MLFARLDIAVFVAIALLLSWDAWFG